MGCISSKLNYINEDDLLNKKQKRLGRRIDINEINKYIRNSNIIRNKDCYTCSRNFDSNNEFIACFYCRINIHYECYNNFNSNLDFDLCPMCQRVATLYHSDLEKERQLDGEVLYINLVLD
jgi:hypothetical protein